MKNKFHIVYLGCSGFPFGMAEVQKMILISKGLVKRGNDVNIISNWTMFKEGEHPGFSKEGNIWGINYTYTTDSAYQAEGKFSRKWQRFRGVMAEMKYLYKLKKEDKLDFAILSTHGFRTLIRYVVMAKILGFKTILNYVEFNSGIQKRKSNFSFRVNDYLFDKWGPKLVNANLPISEFLIEHLNAVAPGKKYLKIPVLTDFEKFSGLPGNSENTYFLYCGAAQYIKVVKFIIDSYSSLQNPHLPLHLVVNGSAEQVNEIKDYVSRSKYPNKISFFSKLSEEDLFCQYKNAAALLIPLRPNIQDLARFPHKIGEYLASGNPVISTNYGEVKYYFSHQENMLLSEHYDVQEYAAQMQFVIDNPEKSKQVGKAGFDFGKKHFDYLVYGELFSNFLSQL
ncbi:MAG: glycosyltransferase [Bacteroidetes bacterium]|nr:glycosyltransferase [Bacteroidota bacterium]